MNDEDLKTYKSGYYLIFTQDISKKDIVDICKELNKSYMEELDEEAKFEPEPMTDGFIYRADFSDSKKLDKAEWKYKSMRLNLGLNSNNHIPSVPKNVMEVWKDSEDLFIPKTDYSSDNYGYQNRNKRNYQMSSRNIKRFGYGSFLKAFYNAPKWSEKELNIIKDVLSAYGIFASNLK